MGSRSGVLAASLALAVLAAPSVARADDPDPETRLWQQSEGTRRWYYTWATFFAVATAGEAGLAINATDRDQRAPAVVSTVTSAIGLVSTLAIPPISAFAHERLRAMPNGTPEERAARRAAAEKLLREAGEEQRFGRSVLAHAAGAVVNLAAGAVLWAGYGQPGQGAWAFVSGTAVSELKIWTQPTGLIDVGPAVVGTGLSVRGSF